jgi:hypothetical protein
MTKDRKRSYKKISKNKEKEREREKEKWIFGGIGRYNTIKRGGARKTYKRYKKKDSRKKYYR